MTTVKISIKQSELDSSKVTTLRRGGGRARVEPLPGPPVAHGNKSAKRNIRDRPTAEVAVHVRVPGANGIEARDGTINSDPTPTGTVKPITDLQTPVRRRAIRDTAMVTGAIPVRSDGDITGTIRVTAATITMTDTTLNDRLGSRAVDRTLALRHLRQLGATTRCDEERRCQP